MWSTTGIGAWSFTLYILPLSKLIQSFLTYLIICMLMIFRFYIKVPINSSPDSNLSLSNVIRHINFWLLSNVLLLNETKTELINISHSQSTFPPLPVNNSLIQPFIKNLGFIFDTNLNYDRHISNLYKLSNLHIYKIRSIRKFITKQSCSILINSLIFSRLDYCNSLLCSLPSISIFKLIVLFVLLLDLLLMYLILIILPLSLHFFPHLNGYILKTVAYLNFYASLTNYYLRTNQFTFITY